MRVLLFSMPDSFEHMAPVAVRMPNGALASLAGNLDPRHDVAIADLVLVDPEGAHREAWPRVRDLEELAELVVALS